MVREIFCVSCGDSKRFTEGTKLLYAASAEGEPAEYGRFFRGTLRPVSIENRTVKMYSGEKLVHRSVMEHLVCDWCNAPLRTDATIWCRSLWTEVQGEQPRWEHEYLKELDPDVSR